VTPGLWRRLSRSATPRARVRKGNHIEISKAHQVIYEVRKGKVQNVIHTSTGATGNTPVGRWRVYYKDAGYNASHMYYSLFFLRGFAIHGYASVPPWPASHGCARIPLWIAPGLYSRWGYGSRIIVFP
jgi:lipoprotein-anchoring transpeptidase ErfK/SrfK